MKKEAIICVIILIFIFIGDIITQKYSRSSAEKITKDLQELEMMVDDSSVEANKVEEKTIEIENKWDEKHNILAYFIEHEELEKVKTELVSIKSFVQSDEISETKNEIDKTIYILRHIVEKNKVNLRNIF